MANTATAKKVEDDSAELEFTTIEIDAKARRWIPGNKPQGTLKQWCAENCTPKKWSQRKSNPWRFAFMIKADADAFNEAWNSRVKATKAPDDKRNDLGFEEAE